MYGFVIITVLRRPLQPLMNRSNRLSLMVASVLLVIFGSAGCVYRINIQQGNLLDDEAIERIEPGMNRSQVSFLLGTPMVRDPFNPDRWDYVYYFKQGRSREVLLKRVTVFFDGDTVERIEQIEPEIR